MACSIGADIHLWQVAPRQQVATLTGHTLQIEFLAFSPDGKTLASGSDDRTARLWDLGSKTCTAILSGHPTSVMWVGFSPDGKVLAARNGSRDIAIVDLATGERRAKLSGHKADINCIAYHPTGDLVASGGLDSVVRLWDVAQAACVATVPVSMFVLALAFGPNDMLAASVDNNFIEVWQVR